MGATAAPLLTTNRAALQVLCHMAQNTAGTGYCGNRPSHTACLTRRHLAGLLIGRQGVTPRPEEWTCWHGDGRRIGPDEQKPGITTCVLLYGWPVASERPRSDAGSRPGDTPEARNPSGRGRREHGRCALPVNGGGLL